MFPHCSNVLFVQRNVDLVDLLFGRVPCSVLFKETSALAACLRFMWPVHYDTGQTVTSALPCGASRAEMTKSQHHSGRDKQDSLTGRDQPAVERLIQQFLNLPSAVTERVRLTL